MNKKEILKYKFYVFVFRCVNKANANNDIDKDCLI